MSAITEEHIVQSVQDALQYISYYHPADFVDGMVKAYEAEESPAAKNAIGQILINSKMCAMGHRPICQDTGMVNVFVKLGLNANLDIKRDLLEVINEGVAKAYTHPDNTLRFSVLSDPAGERKNTKDNTPAVLHVETNLSDKIEITVAAKGGGSENKAKFGVLNPSDNLEDWIIKQVESMGAGWCPPGILGIGIGGNPEKAMIMAKESLMDPVDMTDLKKRGPKNHLEQKRISIYDKVNALGIGAQGLGGQHTVLDVKIKDYPTHAASLPVAIVPNCAATRHIHFTLDGSGPVSFERPDLDSWPDIELPMDEVKRVNVSELTKADLDQFKAGDTLLISGKILTGRDAAHKKIVDMMNNAEELPVDLKNRMIYYVGPVDPVGDEVVGPAGPTTSTRMDKFSKDILETGILGMIGKAERGDKTVELIKEHKSIYLIATGGAAYLISKAITGSKTIAFGELGMEAIYEFEIKDMPVTVAVDNKGNSVHKSGPLLWKKAL